MLTPPPVYYTETPMHDFNHRNPWVHLSTQIYGECHNLIFDFTKTVIPLGIGVVGVFLGILLTTIILLVRKGFQIYGIVSLSLTISFLFCILYTGYTLWNFLGYNLTSSPAMQKFKEISDMKMSEIVTIELEVVISGIHLLKEFKGEIVSEVKWRKRMIYALLFSEFIAFCINIIMLFQ